MFYFILVIFALSVRGYDNNFNYLLINTPAHSCQELFDTFPTLCNVTGYEVQKSGTILCENSFSTCSTQSQSGEDERFCALDDCCGPSEVITGTCEQFFDARGYSICETHGFDGPNANETVCEGGDNNACDAFTCCGPQASSCDALFALNENPTLENDVSTYNGTYSCNIHKWYQKVDDTSAVTPIVAGDYVRADCCEEKQTCGVLYDNWNGTDTCFTNGYNTALDASHHCDPTTNDACTITDCCSTQISCKAYNLEANGLSTIGNAQSGLCFENGYAYAQPYSSRPCYGGDCKHKDCCIRQLQCTSYSADNNRICQNQGYPFYEPFNTTCLKGLCNSYQCCALQCEFGYNTTTRECHTVAQTCTSSYVWLVNDVDSLSITGGENCDTGAEYTLCDADAADCVSTMDVVPQQNNHGGTYEVYRIMPSSFTVAFSYIEGTLLTDTGYALTTPVTSEADIIAAFPSIENIYVQYSSVDDAYLLNDSDDAATVYIADPSTFPLSYPSYSPTPYAPTVLSSESNYPIAFVANSEITTGYDA